MKLLNLCGGLVIAATAILFAMGPAVTGARPIGESAGTSLPLEMTLPPIAPGPAPDLALVFSSQVAGWVEPCG